MSGWGQLLARCFWRCYYYITLPLFNLLMTCGPRCSPESSCVRWMPLASPPPFPRSLDCAPCLLTSWTRRFTWFSGSSSWRTSSSPFFSSSGRCMKMKGSDLNRTDTLSETQKGPRNWCFWSSETDFITRHSRIKEVLNHPFVDITVFGVGSVKILTNL